MEFMSKPGVYKIQNKINNKIYIGSSYSISKRISEHKYNLSNNKHANKHLQSSWNKYGEENFVFSVVLYLEQYNQKVLQQEEQKWIDHYNCANRDFGYNLCPNAYTKAGYKMDEESRKNISNGLRKRFKNNPDAKVHISNLNKKRIEKYGVDACIHTNKLSKDDVIYIASLNKKEIDIKEIADLYNVSIYCIRDILNGKTWSFVTNIHQKRGTKKFKKEDVLDVVHLYEDENLEIQEIADKYNTSISIIKNILSGKTFSDITKITKRSLPKFYKNSIPVFQYDLFGNFIKKWNSLSEIERENDKFKRKEISKHCKENTPYKGYVWKYA